MKRQQVRLKLMVVAGMLAGIVLLQGGCGPKLPENMPRAFVAESYDTDKPGGQMVHPKSKYVNYEADVKTHCGELPAMDDKNYAQLTANMAAIEFCLGNTQTAAKHALDSQFVMRGDVKGEVDKVVEAALGSDESLIFKGEFFEDAMLNSMVGICNLMIGDTETAAIGFRRALVADKRGKDEENFRDDFNLAHWGLGMTDLDSDMSNASVALRKAGYKDAATVKEENMVFVIFLGKMPWKALKGLYGEQATFTKSEYEPGSAEVFVDGKSLGRSTRLINMFEQSQQVVFDKKSIGRAGKAVGKVVLAAFAGAILGDVGQHIVESGINIKADNRTCYMLPNEVHAVSGKAEPGSHTVQVKFYNASNEELNRYEQVWHYVVAPETGRKYYALRSEFDRCNVQGAIPFTRINKVKTKKNKETGVEHTTVRFRSANLPNLKVGNTMKVCHFYSRTQYRTCVQDNWRHAPMAYNNKGEIIGYPGIRFRMQDYDVGLIGTAKVTEIGKNGQTGYAEMTSLTTDYKPREDDMVTTARSHGRIWQVEAW